MALAIATTPLFLPSCSSDNGTDPSSDGDTSPPATIDDLSVEVATNDPTVTLHWTAPGDDGDQGQASRYELRYYHIPLTLLNWTQTTELFPRPTPEAAGNQQTYTAAVPPGTWYFGIRTADEVPNWSGISNVVSIEYTNPDMTAPSRVSDLRAVSSTASSITLAWTASGDDAAEGTADAYEIRYAFEPIDVQNWDDAQIIEQSIDPAEAGEEETFNVESLEPATAYFFALRVRDEVQNWSSPSNSARGTTQDPSVTITQLTHSPSARGASSPAWSPDGAQILFRAEYGDDLEDLYLIASDGGAITQLTHETVTTPLGVGEWYTGGSQIVFSQSRVLESVNAVYVTEPVPDAPATLLFETGSQQFSALSVAPDGERIAYAILTDFPPSRDSDAYIWSNGSSRYVYGGVRIFGLDWSPDGSQLVFSTDISGTNQLWTLRLNGEDPVQLTFGPGNAYQPAWSPDGSQIAFAGDAGGDWDIWVMPSSGGEPRRLTGFAGEEGSPDWSPDGSKICFYRNDNGVNDLWILEF